jgi:ATP-dependent DNA helicase RecQ
MNQYEILKNIFGHDNFRPGQDDIIKDILNPNTKNVLAIMPTSAGKSFLYQIPSLVLGGLNVVISPLIALMKDQVDELKLKGIKAELYNSSLTEEEKRMVTNQLIVDNINLLYISPERLQDDSFIDILREKEINLFAIDESHMISQMGHGFRPDYRKIKRAIRELRPKKVVALTATATKLVQKDIIEQLDMVNPSIYIKGFYRPDLKLEISLCGNERTSMLFEAVEEEFRNGNTTGIIYVGRQKDADSFSQLLTHNYDIPALSYHAGLKDEVRKEVQDKWMKEGGVICATSSFGVGVNKKDVRFVYIATLPGSVEEFYQYVGRASRDGKGGNGIAFIDSANDKKLQRFLIDSSHPPYHMIETFWNWLKDEARRHDGKVEMIQSDMAECAGINSYSVGGCVSVLRYNGFMKTEGKGSYTVEYNKKFDLDREVLQQKRAHKLRLLDDMIDFIDNKRKCRMEAIIEYFGEKGHTCGKCDVCERKK